MCTLCVSCVKLVACIDPLSHLATPVSPMVAVGTGVCERGVRRMHSHPRRAATSIAPSTPTPISSRSLSLCARGEARESHTTQKAREARSARLGRVASAHSMVEGVNNPWWKGGKCEREGCNENTFSGKPASSDRPSTCPLSRLSLAHCVGQRWDEKCDSSTTQRIRAGQTKG